MAVVKILVLNAGSSSQKSRLYELGDSLPASAPTPLWEGNADWTKEPSAADLTIKTASGKTVHKTLPVSSRQAVLEEMLKTAWSGETQVLQAPAEISLVGHRVVHGGSFYRESTRITPEVKATIQQLASFAPLHNPANLAGITAIEHLLGSVPQIAVFDTAFHRSLPLERSVYPGPYAWFEQGIRRYGFHGISHRYCSERITQLLGGDRADLRIVNCHLGNGCSLAAIEGGYSVDTTMGFTPLEGLMMGSRSGTVDPSILLYLQREHNYSAQQLDTILNQESGLLGISGVSSDMRQVLHAVNEGNERAKLAFAMYIYRIRFFIGAMLTSLGGLDVLSFTGGVGENAPTIRAAACEAFRFLHLKLDPSKNAASPVDRDIATTDSEVRVFVIHTEEDWEIAKECWKLATP